MKRLILKSLTFFKEVSIKDYQIKKAKEELVNFKEWFDKELISFLKKEKPYSILKWIKYYIEIGGKRVRPFIAYKMIEYFNKGDIEKLKKLLFALEIYHNSILILDDVQDNDEKRRDKPSLWVLIGKSQAINVGFYGILYVADLIKSLDLEENKKRQILEVFDFITKKTVEGQFLDFYLKDNWTKLSKKEMLRIYLKNNILKTAYYLLLPALSVFKLYSNNKKEEKNLTRDFIYVGLAFQIMNDLEDVFEKKNDLKKGLPTLPYILVMNEKNKELFLNKDEKIIDILIEKNIIRKILLFINKISAKINNPIAKEVLILIIDKIKKIEEKSKKLKK
jgi:geranylgeranyl pyrophosphate synthase